MTDVIILQIVYKVLRREHVCVVPDFQCEGLLVKMVNTGHPQSRIMLESLALVLQHSLRYVFPVRCRSAVTYPCPVPRTIPPVPLAYCFSCRS